MEVWTLKHHHAPHHVLPDGTAGCLWTAMGGVFYNPIDIKWPGRDEFGGAFGRVFASTTGSFGRLR